MTAGPALAKARPGRMNSPELIIAPAATQKMAGVPSSFLSFLYIKFNRVVLIQGCSFFHPCLVYEILFSVFSGNKSESPALIEKFYCSFHFSSL